MVSLGSNRGYFYTNNIWTQVNNYVLDRGYTFIVNLTYHKWFWDPWATLNNRQRMFTSVCVCVYVCVCVCDNNCHTYKTLSESFIIPTPNKDVARVSRETNKH